MEKSIITVTGATGYIASWIVHNLLLDGHEVRVTVRNKEKKEKYQHLLDLANKYEGTLKVFEADLLIDNSFDEAIEGSKYVIHTASPFVLDDKENPEKNLIMPAVQGTKNVLTSVKKFKSVKRIVLTSSLAAIYGDNKDLLDKGNTILDESVWNTTSTKNYNAYNFSKTNAEQVAWNFVENQNHFDLVTINPGFVLGPSITKRVDSYSIKSILRILRGALKFGAPNIMYAFSDVRDVAKGHILATFNEKAKGRYIIANEKGTLLKVSNIIKKEYGTKYKMPKSFIPKWLMWIMAPMIGFTRKYINNNVNHPFDVSNEKSIKELGMKYTKLSKTICDNIEQLKVDGLI